MNKKIQLFLAAAVLMFGCSKEEPAHIGDNPNSSLKKMEIVAGMPGDLTKTSFTDGSIKWQAEDALSVFVAGETNYKFNIKSGVGESEATFEGTAENGNAFLNNVAYYPYSEDVTVSHTNGVYTLNATFPAVQTYAANGSFGQNSLPMVAVTETTDITDKFQFNTLGGWLQLYVKGDKTITKVVMKAKGHKVAGAYSVTAACGQTPVMNMSDAAVSYVAVDCGTGIQLSNAEATLFTFAVAPFSFAAGEVSFDIYDNEGKFMPNAYTVPKGGTVIANAYYRISASAPIQYVGQEPAVKIGEVAYASLKDALAEVENGQTITLLGDVTTDETLVVAEGKIVTIDLSGKNLVGTLHKNVGSVLKNNGELILKNGTIKSTAENGGSAVINAGVMVVQDAILNGAPNANGSWPSYTVNNTGNLTINNTTITSYHGAVASYNEGAIVVLNDTDIDMAGIPGFTNHAIYTYSNGRVVVNGGEIANKATDQNSTGASVINGSVEVNAGNFIGRIENYYGTPILKGGTYNVKPNAKFIPAGYSIVENKIENVTYYSVVETMSTSAALQNAINNAKEGEVIYVGENITLDETIFIPEGKVITIDLNGKTITFPEDKVESTYAIRNLGNLTVKDSDSKGGGVIKSRGIFNGYTESEKVVSSAVITINSGNYYAMGKNGGAAIFNYATAEIKGGYFESNGGYGLNTRENSVMTIDGAKIKGGIYNCGDVTIGEGTEVLQHLSGKHAIYVWKAKLTINNGKFDSQSGNELIMVDGEGANVVLKDGEFKKSAKSWLFAAPANKNITFNIYGGIYRGYVNEPEMTVDPIRDYSPKEDIVVYGGNYNFDPTKWLAKGHVAEKDKEGMWVVEELPYSYDEYTNTYTLSTVDGLYWLANEINSIPPYEASKYDSATFKLAQDIDLQNQEWIPIGDWASQRTEFHGVFDGQGFTIKNIKISEPSKRTEKQADCPYGFFGNLTNGTIKNLTVENVSISNVPKFIGALVGRMNGGLIENCHVKNSSVICKNWTIGGLVGQYSYGKIDGCSVSNTTITGYAGVGAIVGLLLKSGKPGERYIENCAVTNCDIVQNGSFGGSYDYMFGTIIGGVNDTDLRIYLNNCVATENTIKSVASNALYGYVEKDGGNVPSVIIVDGYEMIADGLGYNTSTQTYAVFTANGLVTLSNMTIKGGEKVVLTADIDLTDVEFTGLSAFNPENNNTFDGNGYTVSNWIYTAGASDMGFIKSWVGPIKNVTIKNASLKTNGRSAVLAAKPYSNIDNCHIVDCTIEDTYWSCGGIAGQHNSGSISNCTIYGLNIKSNGATGAIVGLLNETGGTREFKNCTVKNSTVNNTGIYGEGYCGALVCGMINLSNSTVNFENCLLENNIKEGQFVGDLYYAADDDITINVK